MALSSNDAYQYAASPYQYDYEGEEEEEMPATERELAEDAQWKIIQKNTFTRWANEHLKTVNKNVVDLESDFADGLRLIALVEVLSGKKFSKYNRRPNFRTQKLENVTMCLKFLEEDEGIRIVNIDSTDIVDHKLKLILGLIWTLILHYSISMPTWEDDSDAGPNKSKKPDGKKEQTPKQKLLAWVQNKIPERPITNFTTDWNDGITIGALVDNIAPGLCPDWPDWIPVRPKENATEAMDKAEQWLGVPQLIKPEELINPKKDELSMMTYLSQFPSAKLQPGAPLKPRLNPKKVRAYGPGLEPTGNCVGAPARFTIDIFSAGDGIPSIVILNPSGQVEHCEIKKNFRDEDDRKRSGAGISDTDANRNKTFSCTYTPKMQGTYRVEIKYGPKNGGNQTEIPKSPFEVGVDPRPGDAAKCTAMGPGIEPNGNISNRGTYFKVETENAGVGVVDVAIKDPNDNYDTVRPLVKKESPTTWLVQYTAKVPGRHHVTVKFAGRDIPGSAFTVNVSPESGPPFDVKSSGPEQAPSCSPVQAALACFAPPPKGGVPFAEQPAMKPQKQAPSQSAPPVQYAYVPKPIDSKKVYATGRGLQPKGVRVGDIADFKVHTELAGSADLKAEVLGPGGRPIPCQIRKKDANLFECFYEPKDVGDYKVIIQYGGQDIAKSPFSVHVGPYKESRIRAYGPGLEAGVVNFPAKFTVETNGETGSLGFQIEGPSQAKISCDDNRDGSADVTYYPTQLGEYAVHILCNDEDIPKSPYMVPFTTAPSPDFDPSRVEASGPGLEKSGNTVNKWAEFNVNTRRAGRAKLVVTCIDADLKPVKQLHVRDNKDGTFFCRYMPERPIKHTIIISYGNVQIPNSPYRVLIEESSDPNKVKVYGPALQPGSVMTFTPTHLNVDCNEAGPGDVSLTLTDECGLDVPVETYQDGPNKFRIDFVPTSSGTYTGRVFFAGQEIPRSPYAIRVEPSFDVSKVTVRDLEKTVPVGLEKEFEIVTSGASKVPLKPGESLPVQVHIKSPSQKVMAAHVEDTIDGSAAKFTCYEPGNHVVDVLFAGQHIPGSPFVVEALAAQPTTPSGDPNKVRAYGPGLAGGTANEPANFTLDTRDAGPGGLGLTIKGPSEARIEAVDKGDGTCDVRYWPTEPGEYTIDVTYADKKIPGAPFVAQINPGRIVDVSGIRAFGPGLQPDGVFLESMTEFTVDARSITSKGDGKVRAFVTSPSGVRTEALVNNQSNGQYRCLYTPRERGSHKIDVTYEGIKIPRSPFTVNVTPGCDPTRVKAFGPGLEGGHTNQAQCFTVETLGAGQGQLGLSIEGPIEAKLQCEDNRDGSCSVTYIPTVHGTYDIGVKYAGSHVPGSPFHVKISDVVDPTKVRCYGSGVEPYGGRFNEPVTFIVDAANAGVAPLEAEVMFANGQRRPVETRSRGDGTFDATYVPLSEGPAKVNVRYGGKPVPGSPFTSTIQPSFDASKVRVLGDGISRGGVPASLPVSFVIDTRDAGLSDLDVLITDPAGRQVRPLIDDNNDGTYTVSYKPEDLGNYQVVVRYGGQYVPGAPFIVPAFPIGDASKVRVPKNVPEVIPVGQECVIKIDTGEAGQGAITCRISTTGDADVDLDIVDNEDGTVSLMYTPRIPGAHTLNIKFGGQPVPDGVITQKVMDLDQFEQVQAEQLQSLNAANIEPQYFHPVDFCLPVGPVFNFVEARVHTPSRDVHKPRIEDNKDGTVTVRYQPTEEGLHKLDVLYNGKPIKGSPFEFFVTSVGSGKITAYGPGLTHGVVDELASFTIVTKEAGGGGLSLGIEGPSKAEIKCVDNSDGTCSVSYLPTAPGDYQISIKFAGRQIDGGPFTAKILGEGRPKTQMSLGANEMSLGVSETDISNLRAEIVDPINRRKQCSLKSLPNGHLGISFKPEMVGEHEVHVLKRHPDGSEKPIANSPFKIYVGESDLSDASKVKVYGRGLIEGMANELNEFTINTKEAGYGGLSLSVEGPSKADIECTDNDDGTIGVTYRPTEPGKYIVNVKFADKHVPGSPYLVTIGGDVSGQQMECITRQRELADVTHVGSECELSLKIPATNLADMTAYVESPSGVVERCNIVELAPCHYSIKFVPTEMGIHTVFVRNRGVHIPGSPFQFTVGPITDGGSHKVKASGRGIERGICGQRNEFNVYTREAGAGGLSIAVEGPSKAEIDFEDKKDGSSVVTYVAEEPGEYLCSIKFNDQHIPDSPFKIQLAPGVAHRPNLKQQNQLLVNEPAEFIIDLETDGGRLDAVVVSPAGVEEEAIVQQLERNRHSVRFVPRENGVHDIHVRLNNAPLMDSPYKVAVGQLDADAGRVRAYGEGLQRGRTCEPSKFIVNTLDAGSGALAVTVDGPSKVQLNCREVADGYEFTYTPTAPGDYLITIKYAGNTHVPGSPFLAKVEGPGPQRGRFQDSSEVVVETVTKSSNTQRYSAPIVSDASAVRCSGPGLTKAGRNVPSNFVVDASQAGNNMLLVGVHGPTCPCEKIVVQHRGRNMYDVSYVLIEPGEYTLAVLWGEKHVPGSPFHVHV